MKRYKFLLFDLDYTLLDFDADMTMAFKKLYKSCGFEGIRPYEPAVRDVYERHNNNWWRKFENGECEKPELFTGRFVDFLEETGLSGDPEKMNEDYFRFLGEGGAAYPGALDMLKALSKDYEVYVVTNGNAATAYTRIRNSGVYPLIRDYFVSEDVGAPKPDKRYFDYVFAHIPGFEKETALVIGDSLRTDMLGAYRAGVDSLWYRVKGPLKGDAPLPFTYLAKNYDEIMELLRR